MKRFILSVLAVLFAATVYSQNDITISRYVVFDDGGDPVIGATVQEVEDPSHGVITDFDGSFTITVDESNHIKIRYIGFREVTYSASDIIPNPIRLVEDSKILNSKLRAKDSVNKRDQ